LEIAHKEQSATIAALSDEMFQKEEELKVRDSKIATLQSSIDQLKKGLEIKYKEQSAAIAALSDEMFQKEEELKVRDSKIVTLQSTIDQLKKELESASKKQFEMSTSFSSSYFCNAIDLGLSILWADRNIGASSPENAGDYFAWGEIKPKNGKYDWDSYRYRDNPETLPSLHDAATQNWDSDWCIPTKEQFEELIEKCEWTWKGKGYEVKGKNGNSIYLPAAGWRYKALELVGQSGFYWSSSLYDSNRAWSLYFELDGHYTYYGGYRSSGFPVRAVRCSN